MVKYKRTYAKFGLLSLIATLLILAFGFGGNSAFAYADTVLNYGDVDFLGKSINVTTAENYTDYVGGHNVLDREKAGEQLQVYQSKVDVDKTNFQNTSSTDISTFVRKFEYDFGSELGLDVATFYTKIDKDISSTASVDFSQKSYKYFSYCEKFYVNNRQYIKNYLTASTYANCYSDEYLASLESLKNGDMTFETFFDYYGTHLIGDIENGARLRAFYSLTSDKINFNTDNTDCISSAFSLAENSLSIKSKVVSNLNATYKTSYTTNDLQESFSVETYGGGVFTGYNLDNFSTAYQSWCKSVNNGNYTLVDFNEKGLVPLWEILPAEYTELAPAMKEAFKDLCRNATSDLLAKYRNGNFKDFDGGTGTEEDPFIINEKEHLKNIEDADMNGVYSLESDIDLQDKEWTAIGGNYNEKPFNGTFEGNNHVISNLAQTTNVTEETTYVYSGLFGTLGSDSVVQNLTMNNVNINMTGPAVNDSGTRLFLGAIAGSTKGTIKNVTITGTVSFSKCTNGTVYSGGIVGMANDATIENCTNKATVTANRYSGVAGGIAGYSYNTIIRNCKNYGAISAKCTAYSGHAYAGGMVGRLYKNDEAKIIGCTNYGTYKVSTYSGVGKSYKKAGSVYGQTVDKLFDV